MPFNKRLSFALSLKVHHYLSQTAIIVTIVYLPNATFKNNLPTTTTTAAQVECL